MDSRASGIRSTNPYESSSTPEARSVTPFAGLKGLLVGQTCCTKDLMVKLTFSRYGRHEAWLVRSTKKNEPIAIQMTSSVTNYVPL